MEDHTHYPVSKEAPQPWTECITPEQCEANPARKEAHGGKIYLEVCDCGHVRACESNNNRTNYGDWSGQEELAKERRTLGEVIFGTDPAEPGTEQTVETVVDSKTGEIISEEVKPAKGNGKNKK